MFNQLTYSLKCSTVYQTGGFWLDSYHGFSPFVPSFFFNSSREIFFNSFGFIRFFLTSLTQFGTSYVSSDSNQDK